MRSSACARHFILQNKAETRHRPMGNPIGRFFRFVIAPLRMQQGSLTCHCEPCAARRGNLAVPGWIMGKLSAKSQLPSRDSHVASLLGMTSRRCVSFEQWPVLIGSACRALSVTFGDSSPRGRAKGDAGERESRHLSAIGKTPVRSFWAADGRSIFLYYFRGSKSSAPCLHSGQI